MTTKTISLAIAALLAGSAAAVAQTTIIRESTTPSVTIERPAIVVEPRDRSPSVTIERRTDGLSDCQTKTVRKEDATGSTTVKRKECD